MSHRTARGESSPHEVVTTNFETVDSPARAEIACATQDHAAGTLGDARCVARETGVGQMSRYEVLEEIARGGMGAVLRVRDANLDRTLAMKVLLTGLAERHDVVRRFWDEAQLNAQLQHPGIAPVHEVGRLPDGRPFFTMKLIEGQTLAALLNERPSTSTDLPRFLKIFEQVAHTLAYAHSRGVIHRDLKPLNLMIGAFGEVQVMDWGLAKRSDGVAAADVAPSGNDTVPTVADVQGGATLGYGSQETDAARRTQAGQVLGTPAYMPPEQARGEIDQLDERCDVFGLGAILCEILTGAPPFRGDDFCSAFARAQAGDLSDAAARLANSGADPELVALAAECLSTDRAARPIDGSAVARRIADYLASVDERLRSAQADRAAAQARADGERKRRRLVAAVAALALLIVAGAGGFVIWRQADQAQRKEAEAARAREDARQLVEVEEGIASSLRESDSLNARAWSAFGDPAESRAQLAAATSALQRAKALAAPEATRVDGDLRRQMQALESRLAADAKDRTFADALEEVQVKLSEVDPVRSAFRVHEALPLSRELLASYGIEIGATSVEHIEQLLRKRPEAFQPVVAEALDMCLGATRKEDADLRAWLVAVLARIDRDAWRGSVRQAISNDEAKRLVDLSKEASERQPSWFLVSLAKRLRELDRREAAVELLTRVHDAYADDFWINHELGWTLSQIEGRDAEATAYFMAARALRSDNAGVLLNLSSVASAAGFKQDSLRFCRQAIKLNPKYAAAYYILGINLYEQGDNANAEGALRDAILRLEAALAESQASDEALVGGDLKGWIGNAHLALGSVLRDKEDFAGAAAHFEKAAEIKPGYVSFTYLGHALMRANQLQRAADAYRRGLEYSDEHDESLGVQVPRDEIAADRARSYCILAYLLQQLGNDAEAMNAFRKSAECDDKLAEPHAELGRMLFHQGDRDAAVSAWEEALKRDPKSYVALYGMGTWLNESGKFVEAAQAFEGATESRPDDPLSHFELGNARMQGDDTDGAIAAFRKAIELDPEYPEAHCNLGLLLNKRCQFTEALELLQRGHALGSKRPDWPYPSDEWVQRVELSLSIDRHLPAVLSGEITPDDDELANFAAVCFLKGTYADATGLFEKTFAAKPDLLHDPTYGDRYHAVVAALRAGFADDADPEWPASDQSTKLRKLGREWLSAELAVCERLADGVEAAPTDAAARAAFDAIWQRLKLLKSDAALAVLRDDALLARLSDDERAAFEKIDADWEALRLRAEKLSSAQGGD